MSLSSAQADELLNIYRATNVTAPVTMYVGLATADGVEISASGYARVAITFTAPATSGSTRTFSNNAQVNLPAATADWGTARYFLLFSASSGGTARERIQMDDDVPIYNTQVFHILVNDLEIAEAIHA